MKKIKKLILVASLFISILFTIGNVYASSSSISISPSSPTKGKPVTITITVSNVNTVSLTATISGAGTSGKIKLVDASMSGDPKTFSKSLTVTPTSTGTLTVKIDEGSNAVLDAKYVNVLGSRSVTVKAPSSNTNTNTNTNNNNNSNSSNSDSSKKEENKSNDNKLSSLTISKGTLSPKFSANTTSYKVDLTSDIETVDIAAKANDSKAKVTGTGKKDLVIGSQTYSVTVVSESGIKKVYSITFNVTEKPTVFTQFGDQKLGILKDVAKIEVPEGYKETTVTLEGEEIRGWKNDKTGLTLVYLADESGHKSFYIYSDGKVANKYELITIAGKKYTLLDIPSDMKEQEGLKADKVKIGDMELDGWSYEDKNHANYAVVYLMNEAGEKNLYSYEKTEGTLQKYAVSEEKKANNTLTYVLAGTTALFALSTLGVYMMYMNFKKKSIATIKDYYDRKNQG